MSDTTQTPDIQFGSWLKNSRIEKKISLEEIAAVTKVHIAQLKMLEEDNWSHLPAPAFVRGFLVCYARHINIDEEEVLRRYKAAMGNQLKTIESALPEGHRSIASPTRPKVRVASTPNFQKSPGAREVDVKSTPTLTPKKIGFGIGAIVIIVIIVLLISLGKKSDSKAQEVQPAPAPEVSTTPVVTPAPEVIPEAPAPTYTLELIGIEDSWVNVKIGDQNSQGFSLKGGERKTFSVSPTAQLVLSNAGVVELRWEGKHYAPIGFRGDVKTILLPVGVSDLVEKKLAPKRVIAPRTAPAATPAAPAPGLPGSAPEAPAPAPEVPAATTPATR